MRESNRFGQNPEILRKPKEKMFFVRDYNSTRVGVVVIVVVVVVVVISLFCNGII